MMCYVLGAARWVVTSLLAFSPLRKSSLVRGSLSSFAPATWSPWPT
jgi:hypothetical protein